MSFKVTDLTGVVRGQFGVAIPLTILDADGLAVDISAYTGAVLRAVSPDAHTTVQITAAIVTATAGAITVTPDTPSASFDRDGTWKAQIQLTATNKLAMTEVFEIEVDNKL